MSFVKHQYANAPTLDERLTELETDVETIDTRSNERPAAEPPPPAPSRWPEDRTRKWFERAQQTAIWSIAGVAACAGLVFILSGTSASFAAGAVAALAALVLVLLS